MKKILAITLVAVLTIGAVFAFAGCSSSGGDKLGFASKTDISMSKDLAQADDGTQSGTVEANTMMVSVIVDNAGKVKNINIDIVQSPVKFDQTGKIQSDIATTTFQSKKELGDKYGMKKNSGIGKEWFEQAAAIEKWMTGKTADQIKNMKLKQGPEGDNITDEADLASSATIGIDDFITVAVAAINNAK